ncbi:predicted protein [Naegleria gruberi]|uniref:Predicted protein n=1 Tax=Naegleria gruberi TaxID=5762 RepID=D2W1Z7_NAEGR|nr:uncharacterized protein NAEGRDRAFT_54074 [Naegleria gruberi]EFC36899.1 predicted protein [Naegleria gruberi]|eukprot:XP_002669643.1 predicted protein [Naegleria gruberi strain NEG-M]
MSSQAHFDPSNYFIDYEAVLDNKEARKIFQDFLQDCRNEEPLLFLDTYAEYFSGYEQVLKEVFGGWADEEKVSLKNSSNSSKQNKNLFRNEVILRVEKIIQTFIEYHSEKELNIGTSQSWLLNYWKLAKEDLLDTFITLTDLKMDQFPRFVRSEKLRNFLKLKGETFTRSIGYDISKGYNVDLRFKPKDLKEQLITDNHIYFGFTLAQDTPDWKLIYEREDLYCYSSNSTYFFGESKGMKLLKAVMYLPFSLEDVSTMLFDADNHNSFDPQTKGFELHDYRPPSGLNGLGSEGINSSYATQCLSIGIDLSLPLVKKRQLSSVATTIQETDLLFHLLHTADFSEEEMPSQGHVKADSLSYYLFYRLSDRFTRLVHVTYTNFDLPFQTNLLSEIFWKKRAKLLFKGFTKTLNVLTKNGTVPASDHEISDCHKHRQAIEDNKKVFPDRSWYKEWLELNNKTRQFY